MTDVRAAAATVAAGYAAAFVDFAVSRGARRGPLLERVGLEPEALTEADSRLPLERFLALIDAGKDLTGDPALALRFGSEADVAEASVVGLLGRSAGTFAEALELLNRYGRLVVDIEHAGAERFQLREDGGGVWIVDTRERPAAFAELTECTFGRLAAVGRQLFPHLDALKAVQVAHPAPPHAASYEEIFGAPVAFSAAANRMLADRAILAAPVRAQQPHYALSILRGHADALLAGLDRRPSLRSQIEEVLTEKLADGGCGVDRVAQRLGLSRRTLHRRLKAEGTTFERVLDELRRRLAADHLGSGLSVKQTAHLLGFSDATAFSRAFKRWTGSSPTAGRRSAG